MSKRGNHCSHTVGDCSKPLILMGVFGQIDQGGVVLSFRIIQHPRRHHHKIVELYLTRRRAQASRIFCPRLLPPPRAVANPVPRSFMLDTGGEAGSE
jgi:hypothetical protein